jgi:glycosyltransferase involved in cell wall biosynthesis
LHKRPLPEDRFERDREGIDVVLLTLDAEAFLQRSLESLYAEVPVHKLIVCDGGSKDHTLAIIQSFPRTDVHVKPEIRTTGKALEFLFGKTGTEWVMITDADLTFPKGWYDEMCKFRGQYDAFDSKRILAYEFYREDPHTVKLDERPIVNSPQMGRREALQKYRVDDDYLWRITDVALRQTIEKNGYRYGKVTSTFHFHHTGEEVQYKSDQSKSATRLVFSEPKEIITNPVAFRKRLEDTAKAYVKYIDPNLPYAKDVGIDRSLLPLLDRQWVLQNGPAWIERYDRARSLRTRFSPLRLAVSLDHYLHRLDEAVHRRARRAR